MVCISLVPSIRKNAVFLQQKVILKELLAKHLAFLHIECNKNWTSGG